MFFNSLDFALFLPLVYLIYWLISNQKLRVQNAFIVVVSYFFYGMWDWRFLGLIILSSIVDFWIGNRLQTTEAEPRRKFLLFLSLGVNLGILAFFKYANFFLDSFTQAFSFFGKPISVDSLKIVLPVGISFYTFQTLSYTIDVYRKKITPTKDIIGFFAFVSFFPQLVAGPIERATHLLPQFGVKRTFDRANAVDGLRQILWGLFKKIVIADNCAHWVNMIYADHLHYSGSTLVIGAVLFSFQIYGDFSGYSDIAIGTSRLFGFSLNKNFAFPYFSRNIAEFWRRWHISLTSWFKDYLYIPLGGSRGSKFNKVRNTMIVFLVSGFWHGANWTFVFWGLINAIYFIPLLLTESHRNYLDVVDSTRLFPRVSTLIKMISCFALITFSWIFFRAESIRQSFSYIEHMLSASLFQVPDIRPQSCFMMILLFLVIEWRGRSGDYGLQVVGQLPSRVIKRGVYYALAVLIIFYGNYEENPFIYFQF